VPEDYIEGGYGNAPDAPQYQGVQFHDGTVVVRWLTQFRSTSVWPDFDEFEAVHGHPDYGTRIEWTDDLVAGIPALERDLEVAEDQANNLAGDVAAFVAERGEADFVTKITAQQWDVLKAERDALLAERDELAAVGGTAAMTIIKLRGRVTELERVLRECVKVLQGCDYSIQRVPLGVTAIIFKALDALDATTEPTP
jgi:hypothetical protein